MAIDGFAFLINSFITHQGITPENIDALKPLVVQAMNGLNEQPAELPTALSWLQLIAATAPLQQTDLVDQMIAKRLSPCQELAVLVQSGPKRAEKRSLSHSLLGVTNFTVFPQNFVSITFANFCNSLRGPSTKQSSACASPCPSDGSRRKHTD